MARNSEIGLMREQGEIQYDTSSRLQDEGMQSQGRLAAPQLREQLAEAQAAVIAQTNPARALRIILESFRGNIVNEYEEIEKFGQPKMNEEGIATIASTLIPFINDPMRFGNISAVEVRAITLQIVDDITEDIGLHWREYGIKESTDRDPIVNAVMGLIFITLTRSEEQGEKNFLSKVVLESLGAQRPKKKESSWAKYFGL